MRNTNNMIEKLFYFPLSFIKEGSQPIIHSRHTQDLKKIVGLLLWAGGFFLIISLCMLGFSIHDYFCSEAENQNSFEKIRDSLVVFAGTLTAFTGIYQFIHSRAEERVGIIRVNLAETIQNCRSVIRMGIDEKLIRICNDMDSDSDSDFLFFQPENRKENFLGGLDDQLQRIGSAPRRFVLISRSFVGCMRNSRTQSLAFYWLNKSIESPVSQETSSPGDNKNASETRKADVKKLAQECAFELGLALAYGARIIETHGEEQEEYNQSIHEYREYSKQLITKITGENEKLPLKYEILFTDDEYNDVVHPILGPKQLTKNQSDHRK